MLSEYILHIHQDDAIRWYLTIASRYRSVESLKIALIRRTDVFVRLSTVFYHSACVRFVFVKECGICFLVYPDQTSPIPSFRLFFFPSMLLYMLLLCVCAEHHVMMFSLLISEPMRNSLCVCVLWQCHASCGERVLRLIKHFYDEFASSINRESINRPAAHEIEQCDGAVMW